MARSWLFVSTPDISDKLTPLCEWKCAAEWEGEDGGREATKRWIISFTQSGGERYHSDTHPQTHTSTCDITGMQKTRSRNEELRWRSWGGKEARNEQTGGRRGGGPKEGGEDGGQGQMKDRRRRGGGKMSERQIEFWGWKEAKEAREWIEKKQIDKEAIERRFKRKSSRDEPEGGGLHLSSVYRAV